MIVFTDAPTEQEIEAEDGVPKKEAPCFITHVEVMIMEVLYFDGLCLFFLSRVKSFLNIYFTDF